MPGDTGIFDKEASLSDHAAMLIHRRNFVFVLAWTLFWALMILVAIQDFQRNEHSPDIWKPILWEGSSALVASVLVLVQLRYGRSPDELLGRPLRWFARQALWLPFWWIAFTPLAFGIRHGVYALLGATYEHGPWPGVFVYEAMKISIFVGLFMAVRFGIKSYLALIEARLRAQEAIALQQQAQLHRLAQQMQPHFLFNALNTISSLMHVDVDKADATLIQLAGVLRATLALGDAIEAPLQAELDIARGYVGVMAERFAGRVEIAWRIDDALLAQPLPVMSMQPLLENVFKHTVEKRRGLTHIEISAQREHDALVLRVDDDGRLEDTAANGMRQGCGIGLANLRARLAALHGPRASLSLAAREEGGVRAELRVPCAS
jgi:two-component system LytT family sensor kinase